MSMTKRYLESLPADEQDAILGAVLAFDLAFGYDGEWTDSAENEPTDEELAEWARALIEEDDSERRESGPTVVGYLQAQIAEAERDIAKGKRVESKKQRLAALRAVLAREEAPLVKREGKCVIETDANGVQWKL